MAIRSVSIVFLLLSLNCGTKTSLVSVGDESYKGAEYVTVAVSAPYENLQIRSLVESIFKAALITVNTQVYRAMDILPPLRVYSSSEFQSAMSTNGIQCVIVVGISDYWSATASTGGKQVTTSETVISSENESDQGVERSLKAWGNLLGIETRASTTATATTTATTQYVPGFSASESYVVSLDVRMFAILPDSAPLGIWRANSTTRREFFSESSNVMLDAASQIADVLREERILKPGMSLSSMRENTEVDRYFRAEPSAEKTFILGGVNYVNILGCLSCNEFQLESPFNEYGYFGVSSEHTLWDPCGMYASDTSEYSACNPNAKHPPVLIDLYGKEVGKLSINPEVSANHRDSKIKKWLREEICLECETDN